MEEPKCPISTTRATTPFLHVADRFNPDKGTCWSIVRNKTSSLCYLSPRPDEQEIRSHYPSSDYAPFESLEQAPSPGNLLYRQLRKLALKSKTKLILRRLSHSLSPGTSILEIGCSTGELLATLQHKTDATCVGMEPDPEAAAYARKHYRLTVHEQLCAIRDRFDLIIFWHTLEHIHRLDETLERAASLLHENGTIIIALPNAQSADARHFGASWVAWDAPRHLWHFTPATLASLLDKHGLTITKLTAYAPDAIYNSWESQRLKSGEKQGLTHNVYGIFKGLYFAMHGAMHPDTASSFICRVNHK